MNGFEGNKRNSQISGTKICLTHMFYFFFIKYFSLYFFTTFLLSFSLIINYRRLVVYILKKEINKNYYIK